MRGVVCNTFSCLDGRKDVGIGDLDEGDLRLTAIYKDRMHP